jgi:hypothetical protein
MSKKAPYIIFGKDLDHLAIAQMEDAVSLPVSVKGALMPDAHLGNGPSHRRCSRGKGCGYPLCCRGEYCLPYAYEYPAGVFF